MGWGGLLPGRGDKIKGRMKWALPERNLSPPCKPKVVPAPGPHLFLRDPCPAPRQHLDTHNRAFTRVAHAPTGAHASSQLPQTLGSTSSYLSPDQRSQTLLSHGYPLLLVPVLTPDADLGPQKRYREGRGKRGPHPHTRGKQRRKLGSKGLRLGLGHLSAHALPQVQSSVLGR